MSDHRDPALRDWAEATRPSPAALRRVAQGVQSAQAPPRPWGWALGLALAGLALLWVKQPPPALDQSLPTTGPLALGDLVQVELAGEGAVRGHGHDLHIAWRFGEIAVEVTPNAGVALEVTTEEATATVRGTGFVVDRSALGTRVDVRHGAVAVTCALGGEQTLTAGQSTTCLPTTAAGALGRARALDGKIDPAALLAELDQGLSRPGASGALAAELQAMRTTALLALGRDEEALAAAEAALATEAPTRAVALHRVAARLALQSQDCPRALPHLQALADADALGEDAAWLTHCQSETRP